MSIELGNHQIKAIKELHNGSVLKGGVGTGKTRTALAYFYIKECGGMPPINGGTDHEPMAHPKDIFVFTTARKRDSGDWMDEAAKFGISRDPSISAGHVRITVDSWNNIPNYVDTVKDAFVVLDEQRLVGNGAWVKAFIKLAKNNNWIVLSATPGDTWMDYIPIFIANGWYKNRTEFMRTHVVWNNYTTFPKVDHYVEVNRLVKQRNAILVEMPYTRATIRHIMSYVVRYDEALWDRLVKDRWNIYTDKPIKDISELFVCMRKLVNTDPSRTGALLKLMEKHPRLIVFYNYDYELEMLRVIPGMTGVTTAEWNGHKHEEVPETEKWLYFVQYTAGAEAWNCTTTDAMAFWSLNYSYKAMEQSMGRIDRLNTPFIDLYYYRFRSNSPIDQAISKALVLKRNFNEKELKFDGFDKPVKKAA